MRLPNPSVSASAFASASASLDPEQGQRAERAGRILRGTSRLSKLSPARGAEGTGGAAPDGRPEADPALPHAGTWLGAAILQALGGIAPRDGVLLLVEGGGPAGLDSAIPQYRELSRQCREQRVESNLRAELREGVLQGSFEFWCRRLFAG